MPSGRRDVGELGLELAAEIRAVAARVGLRHTELAVKAKIPVSTMTKLLNGTTPFDVDQLSRIATALDTESSDLMRRAEFSLAAKTGTVQPPAE